MPSTSRDVIDTDSVHEPVRSRRRRSRVANRGARGAPDRGPAAPRPRRLQLPLGVGQRRARRSSVTSTHIAGPSPARIPFGSWVTSGRGRRRTPSEILLCSSGSATSQAVSPPISPAPSGAGPESTGRSRSSAPSSASTSRSRSTRAGWASWRATSSRRPRSWVPDVGVGLLYRRGYFHQCLDPRGWQHEYWIESDPWLLPIPVHASRRRIARR